MHWEFVDGVVVSWKGSADRDTADKVFEVPNRAEFSAAMSSVMDLAISGPAKTFCHNRLHVLEARFNLHELLNHDIEQLVQKSSVGEAKRTGATLSECTNNYPPPPTQS